MKPDDIEKLNNIAKKLRKEILLMTAEAGGGHYMSSLSTVEILVSLYFSEIRINVTNPEDPNRDRFVLSKGHAAPALYAIMAETGYFPVDELKTLRRCGSRLQGHPVMHRLPGLDTSSGSLGQGISTAVGIALAGKMDKRKYRVFVLLGDGECQEGIVWEAAMSAAHFKLDNLIAIIDKNNLQISGPTEKVMSLGDLKAKWEAFGWSVFNVNGHDIPDLLATFKKIKTVKNKPIAIIADTIKGCGVPFIENNLKYHTVPLNEEELKKALDCVM
ncbi:transketolase [Methanoregula sp.]|uniref:transketolase n=1 Tax=Methanoregula sp. TaxID=2052170 RepID=UPI00356A1BF8